MTYKLNFLRNILTTVSIVSILASAHSGAATTDPATMYMMESDDTLSPELFQKHPDGIILHDSQIKLTESAQLSYSPISFSGHLSIVSENKDKYQKTNFLVLQNDQKDRILLIKGGENESILTLSNHHLYSDIITDINNTNTIKIIGNQIVSGSIGSTDKQLKMLILDQNGHLTLNSPSQNSTFAIQNVIGNADQDGTIKFRGKYQIKGQFGEKNKKLENLTISSLITMPNNQQSREPSTIELLDGSKIYAVECNLSGSKESNEARDNSFILGNNTLVDSDIITSYSGYGNIKSSGTSYIQGNIGTDKMPISKVQFIGNHDLQLKHNIYSNIIDFDNRKILVKSDSILDGRSEIKINNDINLGTNTLTMKGKKAILGNNTSFTVKFDVDENAKMKSGIIEATEIVLQISDKITINILGTPDIGEHLIVSTSLTDHDNHKFILKPSEELLVSNNCDIEARNSGIYVIIKKATNTNTTNTNTNSNVITDTKEITATKITEKVATQYMRNSGFDNIDQDNASILVRTGKTGYALEVINHISDLEQHNEQAHILKKAITPVQLILTNVSHQIVDNSLDIMQNRIDELSSNIIASGDCTAQFGVWSKLIFGQTYQKKNTDISSGYKGKYVSGNFGFDSMINDNRIIGVALTLIRNNLKHTDVKAGDKTTINNFVFSLYTKEQLVNNFFLQLIGAIGLGKVKNEETIFSKNNKIDSSKNNATLFGFKALIGYNTKVIDSILLTPEVGVSASVVNEKATKSKYRTINAQSSYKVNGIIGVRVALPIEMKGVTMVPKAHGFINYHLGGNSIGASHTFDGATEEFLVRKHKLPRTYYNLGLGVDIKASIMQYGLEYDAYLANKYVRHQGSLKVRVNF